MVVVVVLFGLASFGHVVYLRLRPEIRRTLRFPPLPPASTPYPPLPVIEDLEVLVDFFRTSLDDVAEDTTKSLCVAASYSFGWTLVGDRNFRLARTAGMALGLGAYMGCDRLGDAIGDRAADLITSTMTMLGYVPPLPEPKREKNFSLLSRVADDAMEDSFKLVCLWSHIMIGGLLGDNLIVNTFGMQSTSLNWAIRLGVPAAKYNLCNIYADYLGEWVHYHIGHMTQSWSPQLRIASITTTTSSSSSDTTHAHGPSLLTGACSSSGSCGNRNSRHHSAHGGGGGDGAQCGRYGGDCMAGHDGGNGGSRRDSRAVDVCGSPSFTTWLCSWWTLVWEWLEWLLPWSQPPANGLTHAPTPRRGAATATVAATASTVRTREERLRAAQELLQRYSRPRHGGSSGGGGGSSDDSDGGGGDGSDGGDACGIGERGAGDTLDEGTTSTARGGGAADAHPDGVRV
ncbi:hypothetical protein PTSG_02570 [Salpingoeca rosetta]|uniref:Uncharacterized protein n=1 Tax=Salpingoeca rosetta (strain ATCC 50818 / BSB-021) TaxID=946362 RepID=F2U2P0_SALR5|nr:uncharacterized protein PTSG_02570 [Salpingoeca rosetta]EGD81884.1 hypothetical protein PTSG_02570 [Salpingoeca rosetta]|eukprot:XP_004996067.1 hypothetical protein PTSG_02570 [Salpingoeca rosetta]